MPALMKDLVANAKRNCLMCSSRHRLKDTKAEKEIVQDSVKQLTAYYASQYDQLRRDNFSAEEIQAANEKRRKCMDLLQVCQSCDKEVDRVNRELVKILK